MAKKRCQLNRNILQVDNAKEEGIFVAKEIKSLIQQRLVPGGYTEVSLHYAPKPCCCSLISEDTTICSAILGLQSLR